MNALKLSPMLTKKELLSTLKTTYKGLRSDFFTDDVLQEMNIDVNQYNSIKKFSIEQTDFIYRRFAVFFKIRIPWINVERQKPLDLKNYIFITSVDKTIKAGQYRTHRGSELHGYFRTDSGAKYELWNNFNEVSHFFPIDNFSKP